MSGYAEAHNIGATIAAVDAGVAFNSVAGGSNDNTEKAGVIIDRAAHGMPTSMALIIPTTAVLAQGATLKCGYRVEHGDDAALADTADFSKVLVAAKTVSTGPTGGGTKTAVQQVNLDLSGAKRFIRVNVTTDLSAANTDTAVASATVVFGGTNAEPVA